MREKDFGGIVLTPSCCNSCVFCKGQGKATDSEIRRQEENVKKNLSEFAGRKEKIEISGSDPIEFSGIISLIKSIKETGFKYVKLSTHGRRLADESFLEEFIDTGINALRIPLYGPNAAVHDSVTRTKGSFDETLKGIKGVLEKSQIEVQVSCLIVKQNSNFLAELVDFVKDLGVNNFYFSIPCISDENFSGYYIPLKEIGQFAGKAYSRAVTIGFPLKFYELPFCAFGVADRDRIFNRSAPPDLGRHCQPSSNFSSKVKDLPFYRTKIKTELCDGCACFNFCDGFFANDIKHFGTGNIEAIV